MTAEIISVGTELLLGQIVDTHAPRMAVILAECGLVCQHRSTIGDNFARLVAELKGAIARSDVVITIGGLGPTVDDLTRDAIAEALGDAMIHSAKYEQELRDWFARRGVRWTESIARQADCPASGRFVENPFGTAPGLICQKDGKTVIALPGPRGEFNPMADGPVKAFLSTLTGEVIHSVVLRIAGLGESHVEDLVRPLMDGLNPTVAPYAHPGEVHLRVTARAPTVAEAERLMRPVIDEIHSILGDRVFGEDRTTLEESLIALLRTRSQTVAVAESMTGGELAARLSQSPGASQVFLGGATVYTAGAKGALLGLSDEELAQGSVTEAVARALAVSVREKLGATFGLSITGNAGPTAEPGGEPIGRVYLGLAGPNGCQVRAEQFRGLRDEIRKRATQTILTWLRDEALTSKAPH